MTISNSLLHTLNGTHASRARHLAFAIAAWSIGSGVTAELLGYWLHWLLHSGWIGFLSRSHMEHHMVHYGPLQKQRTTQYRDATAGRLALGNIGLEWLIPAALVIAIAVTVLHRFHVRVAYQLLSLGIGLGWGSLMFSFLHDVMHIEGFWLARNRVLKRWFLSARRLHDIHHRVLNDRGLMDKNFGIGFFAFDRLFGTLTLQQPPFNQRGYAVARAKFKYLEAQMSEQEIKGGVMKNNIMRRCASKCLFLLVLAILLPTAGQAQLVVDCTGTTPGTFPSINAALPSAGAGTAIFVLAGPCNESLQLAGWTDLFIGTYNGYPSVAINGSINVSDSHGVYFHGLNITSATGDGINVTQSQALIIDSCTSNGNAGNGLDLGNASEVLVIAPASFDGNSASGINLYGNSYAQLNSWNGQPVDISNNHNAGVWASQASFTTFGLTNITNNSTVGMQLYGGARVQMGTQAGPNTLTGNQQGGAAVQENSEISFFNFGSQTYIQNNGPVGVSAGFGGQVTLYGGVEISGHSGPALDLSGNSQANVSGANNLHNNGAAGDPRSAAIRLDGNSELFLRAGTIAQNIGPAILALVNSSADLAGVSFSSNSGGIVVCDSSSYMVSDLVTGASTSPGVACRTPHALGNRLFTRAQPAAPDFSGLKARQAKMMARATKK